MAGDQTQVVAGRDLIAYTAPFASTNTVPLDTISWGTAWGNPYVDKGFTRDGLRFRMQVQRQNVMVDQLVDPVLRIPTSRDLSMETRLAQINAQNFADATGQGAITSVAAGTGTRGHDDFDVSATITDQYITGGFDIRNPGDLEAIRVIGWKGIVLAAVEVQFQTTDAALLQFNIGLVPDTSPQPTNPPRIAKFRDVAAAL